MSRDGSGPNGSEAGPSTLPSIAGHGTGVNRKPSKSISSVNRPTISITAIPFSHRAKSYHSTHSSIDDQLGLDGEPLSTPIPSLLISPTRSDGGGFANVRMGFKRRRSTPRIPRLMSNGGDEDVDLLDITDSLPAGPRPKSVGPPEKGKGKGKGKEVESRARSSSTSIVVPSILATSASTPFPQPPTLPRINQTPPEEHNSYLSGSIYDSPSKQPRTGKTPHRQGSRPPYSVNFLTSAYNLGESSVLRIARWIRPSNRQHPYPRLNRRRQSDDSETEKGYGSGGDQGDLDGSEADATTESLISTVRTSEDSLRPVIGPLSGAGKLAGGYWMSKTKEGESDGYFSIPPSPIPPEVDNDGLPHDDSTDPHTSSRFVALPTPALSTSLSRPPRYKGKRLSLDAAGEGWWSLVYRIVSKTPSTGSRGRQGTNKTAEVIRELGWTVTVLGGVFIVTAGMALWMIQSMPITQLKHIPSSTTDLQLLSAEIRSYMASADIGWWHTVGVVTFVGCWKHAWSVPGAVVLNILVGSILEPMPALALLTFITATGSLFSYMLSRPLAPLIAVMFPKPLALVRAALAPESIPTPPSATLGDAANARVTPVQFSSNPDEAAIGTETRQTIWRRLLVMRAMGFVPWSGLNVACGVVGVDWRIFWLTTAAGSASWSYVTASVGNILSRLAIPASALAEESSTPEADVLDGESLTSLLRDPVLIAKLVFLSALTLLPVILKRRGASVTSETSKSEYSPTSTGSSKAIGEFEMDHIRNETPRKPTWRVLQEVESAPPSPLTASLKKFTPTPAAFDLLSFGRTAVRQGGKVIMGVGRKVAGG